MSERIAFLGIGLMGAPMAERLVAAGRDVVLWNRTRTKAEAITGARVAATPAAAAAEADVLITMLETGPVVEAVLTDKNANVQSLLNQADQDGGRWDRWTHLTGPTGVMNGDPSAPAVAAIYAFGGRDFDLPRAYRSLLAAATVPTPADRSRSGCPVLCVGERPGLDQWLKLHYMPVGAPGWGSGADTLELAAADFGVAQLARYTGDKANERRFLERSGWWRNLFNPRSAYIQPRNADGSWPAFDPASDDEFVEGSGADCLELFPAPADTDAQRQPALGEVVDGGQHLGGQHGRAMRHHHDRQDEAKLLRQRGDIGRGRQLLQPCGRGAGRELAASGIGIF